MICKNCGNEIEDTSLNCVYCGFEVRKPITAVPLETKEERRKNDKNDIGNIGFVYGIISISCFFVPFVPLLIAILGIIYSSIGLNAPGNGSVTRAKLGFIFSVITISLQLAYIVIIILVWTGALKI